ncbi:hypothetical protein [Microvirga sp. TS319]|uniref:hypothetical protein n=1 Tax=Microvirga sp. TS319 TaxID=3241165 RepID=UPI00351A86BD
MAQPRIFRFIAQALLGLLLLAWLPAVGNELESLFLPQIEETLSFSVPSDDGERDRETARDRWSDGDAPLLPTVCRLTAGVQGRGFTREATDPLLTLDLLEAWRATGPPALHV